MRQGRERDQLTLFEHGDELLPLRTTEIHPGGVMTARVQQHDAARRQLHQITEHPLEIDAFGRGIKITIAMSTDADGCEISLVVDPFGVAYPQLALGEGLVQ